MNRYGDSVSTWRTPEVVLNHSVGPSSVETQAEESQYIWIISLIREFGILYWLRITGIDDLWIVSNAFRQSTKTSDAVMFVTQQVSITYLSAITCSVVDLPARKPLRHWLSCRSIIGFRRLKRTLLNNLALEHVFAIPRWLSRAVELPFFGMKTITLFLQSSGIVFSIFKALEWRFSMSVTSPSNSGIFRTRFRISSRPGDVSLRDVRSAARISVVVNGADSWLLLRCYPCWEQRRRYFCCCWLCWLLRIAE